MFIDEAVIEVEAGRGGDGCVSFRREKHVPRGGPDGGDGGNGGSIMLVADTHLSTLLDFHYKRRYKAGSGGHGSGSNRKGRNGKSITLRVPVGTLVYDADTGDLLADLSRPGMRFVAARGGKADAATRTSPPPPVRRPASPRRACPVNGVRCDWS